MPWTAAAIGGAGALGAGSSLLGSGKSSSASKAAAGQSLQATYAGIAAQQLQNSQNVTRLGPFVQAGYDALAPMAQLAGATPAGTPYLQQAQNYLSQAAGMNPNQVLSQQNLEQTPGYQFTQQQGLKATQAAAAARGLGVSGASLKGAATYATGLADATYSNRFNEAQQSWADVLNQAAAASGQGSLAQQMQAQQYGQQANLANLGESAAAQTAQSGTASANAISQGLATGAGQYGNYLTQAGQAQAAGTAGVGNAITGGINSYLGYNALQGYLQGANPGTTQGLGPTLNPVTNSPYSSVAGQWSGSPDVYTGYT